MSEELAYDTEQITRSRHEKILICRDKGAWNANWNWKDHDATMNFDTAQKARMQELQSHVIDLLIEASRNGNTDKLEPLIKQIVPQFGRTAFISPHERKTIVTPQQVRSQVPLTLSA
jgi:hypothetical protein